MATVWALGPIQYFSRFKGPMTYLHRKFHGSKCSNKKINPLGHQSFIISNDDCNFDANQNTSQDSIMSAAYYEHPPSFFIYQLCTHTYMYILYILYRFMTIF